MYSAMLERAIKEEQNSINNNKETTQLNEAEYINKDVKITIDISANIPDSYISSSKIKIEMYQKLSNANTEEDLREITLELIDRFGNPPKEVENLISVIEIRNICRELDITELKSNCEYFVISPNNLKFRLTKGEIHDILLTIKATLKDMIKSGYLNKNIEKGKI
jgi:transcription-repair coupling factor (superfamily II helicase)